MLINKKGAFCKKHLCKFIVKIDYLKSMFKPIILGAFGYIYELFTHVGCTRNRIDRVKNKRICA
ncbi:hypothetical protein TAESTU_20016 [Tenacibaculum aestuarii]